MEIKSRHIHIVLDGKSFGSCWICCGRRSGERSISDDSQVSGFSIWVHKPWNWKTLAPWKKSYDQPRQHIKQQKHHFADKGLYSQSYGFSGSHVWMWELDYNEGWALKNWCFQTVMLGRTLESPLDSREIKLVNLKGNQPWISIGRTDAEAEALILWLSNAKS